MDVTAHKYIAVAVGRWHRVVVEPIAHQRQRGDSRGHLLAGVVRRRQRRLEGGKVALQPLADRPITAAQTVSHSTAAAFQQIGVQRLEALEHRDWYEEVASRIPTTDATYRRRYDQLKRDAARYLPKPLTLESFIVRLIETKRPTWSASSWRQNRAATVYGLELDRSANPGRAAIIDAAIARLKDTRPAKRANSALRTSQQKAKRLLPDDLDRICHRALAGRAPNAQALADMLNSSNITGLRPREWPTAEFRQSQVPGFAFELIVRNGKRDAKRAHGEFRTLRWTELSNETVAAITNWITQAREAENAGAYKT